MQVVRVTGTIVAARKDPKLEGMKLLLVEQADMTGNKNGKHLVAVDSVGAGVGELVLVCAGSSARQTGVTEGTPVDAVVMGIVDEIEMGGELTYRKGDE